MASVTEPALTPQPVVLTMLYVKCSRMWSLAKPLTPEPLYSYNKIPHVLHIAVYTESKEITWPPPGAS